VGRSTKAATDIQMKAEILSYSRSRGVFAGLSLEGAVLHPDDDANERLYGGRVHPKSVLLGDETPIPVAAQPLVDYLRRLSPTNLSGR
jgi:lipid-binding SYLF domain-containing protein